MSLPVERIEQEARAYSLKKERENWSLSPSERNEIIVLSGLGYQAGATTEALRSLDEINRLKERVKELEVINDSLIKTHMKYTDIDKALNQKPE